MRFELESTIHLSDLTFINFCKHHYGINRGIYNAIDDWFYNQGFENILDRRETIIYFLEFVKSKSNQKGHLFGKGGLKIQLQTYLYQLDSTITAPVVSSF